MDHSSTVDRMNRNRLKWTDMYQMDLNAMLMWLNRSIATMNALLQFLDII